MKILLIVDDYLPESTKAAAMMMHDLGAELLRKGHDVTVLTPSSNLRKSRDLVQLDGIEIWRFKSGRIKNCGRIRRAINESLLSWRAWRALRSTIINNRHEAIVYYSPSIFWGVLVRKLIKIWHVPAYLVLRDFFPQWAIDQNLIKAGSIIEKYFRFFERINYSPADIIGVMSENNQTWFREASGYDGRLEVLYNWGSEGAIEPGNHYREFLGLQEKVVFFYGLES